VKVIGRELSGCLVEEMLGEGGMGAVFLATRRRDGRRVAVKLLPPEQAAHAAWRTRFVRTGELVRRLTHPNIARVLAVAGDEDPPHMIMEWVKGETLYDRIKREVVLPTREAVRIARDIARGLADAHRIGLVHRDVKPGNVLLTPSGRVKVIDFGLGKDRTSHDVLTYAGQVLGTPYYMAPEQWGHHEVDHRCDIFSLGSTLYHLATGDLPFRAERAMDVAPLICQGEFKPPREANPELSRDLELVLYWLMEPDRRLRYQSMEQVADDLQRVFEDRPVDVPRLEEVVGRKRVRHALLPGTKFVLGRRSTCRFVVRDRAVSREHAEIRREPGGFRLRDLGSSRGTFVRESRVSEIKLKDGDPIRLGERTYVFRDGLPDMLASSIEERVAPRREVKSVPEPVLRALVNRSDRRAVLTLIEQLDPATHEARVVATRRLLAALGDAGLARRAVGVLEDRLAEVRRKAQQRLFMITHERLGEHPQAWLAWWDQEASLVYPEQVGPCPPPLLPRPRFRVVKGDRKRTVDLASMLEVRLGRDKKSDVHLAHGSVSRTHATVLRLHERMAIRDESSRLGTVVNGTRVQVAFLRPGDHLILGKVKLVYEEKQPDDDRPPTQAGSCLIDSLAFEALVELGHPSVARALVGFVRAADQLQWAEDEARWFFPEDDETRERVVESVRKHYDRQSKKARELLPDMLGKRVRRPDDWRALLEDRLRKLPTQVLPVGWGLPV